MRHILILPDGSEISSGRDETKCIRDITITETVNSGQELTVGSVCASMMEVTALNPGGLLRLTAGDTVTLIEETNWERKQVGIFTLERPRRKTANLLNLTGYDNVSKLDKDLSQWLSGLDGWPYTLYELAAMTCQACGLELETEEILNGDYMVDRFEAEATGRQLLSWIGELSCSFVRANPEGRVEFGWYREQDIFIEPSGKNFYYQNKLSYEDYTVAAVDAVQVNMGEYLWPDAEGAENVYLITGNPLIQRVDNSTMEALERVRERLSAAVYTPCTVTVPMDTDVKPGSICRIRDANGVEITTWIMSRVRKGMRDQLESTGSARRDSPEAVYNKSTDVIAQQKVDALSKELSQKEILKRLTGQWADDGIYLTEDGKLAINASAIVSALGDSFLSIDGAAIILLSKKNKTFELTNLAEGLPILYMKDYNESGEQTNSCELTAHHLKIGGTSLLPVFYLTASDGEAMLWLNGEENGKTLEWRDNGDGTFSLIGR